MSYSVDVTSKWQVERLPAALGATANDVIVVIANAPVIGEVRAARFCPMTTLAAGDGTNNRVINLVKGTAPTFGTTMGTITNNGQIWTADTVYTFTMGDKSARRFAVGESVAFSTAHNGTGGALAAGDSLHIYYCMGEYDYAQA